MKVLLWTRFVGGRVDGKPATPACLMAEGPVQVEGSTYGKRKLVVCQQPILILVESRMSTAEASAALLRAVLRSHPDATDSEPQRDTVADRT